MWMLLVLLQSPLTPDAKLPVETFYKSIEKCKAALKSEADKGHFQASCIEVNWKD